MKRQNADEAIEKYAERFQAVIDERRPAAIGTTEIQIMWNRKYARVIEARKFESGYGGRTVLAFVDRSTGDIYKPDGWSGPAKHVRGSVFSDESGEESISSTGYGVKNLR